MSVSIPGLHHVTAICGDPNPNAEFYVGTLGLRLVKYTVNHDDPTTPHLYYGDARGTPGTNITFFPWSTNRPPGHRGAGQTRSTAYLVRPDSLDFWRGRLESRGINHRLEQRFGDSVISFQDPDGIGIELIADDIATDADIVPWEQGPVDPSHQLRGFHSVSIAVASPPATIEVLEEVLGYRCTATSENRHRLIADTDGPGTVVDVIKTDDPRGRAGIGSVHHVAFKVIDEQQQQRVREALMSVGLSATEPIDRIYFKSVYCREPGGVLYEFATPGPGFDRDEPADELGTNFVLPDWLEEQRQDIQDNVPDFTPPAAPEW